MNVTRSVKLLFQSVKEDSSSFLDLVNQRDTTPRPESAEDTQSVDLDLQSETSEATTVSS